MLYDSHVTKRRNVMDDARREMKRVTLQSGHRLQKLQRVVGYGVNVRVQKMVIASYDGLEEKLVITRVKRKTAILECGHEVRLREVCRRHWCRDCNMAFLRGDGEILTDRSKYIDMWT